MTTTSRRQFLQGSAAAVAAVATAGLPRLWAQNASKAQRPNIVLIMTDDQGWGETGYYNHPVLKTPNLDAMAANGLRFDRFYAAGPVCSPTRASVMTGRTHDRTGVTSHGINLRLQEKTLSQALKAAGYATGHFGKWHLNGIRGAGVPVFGDDPHSPGAFGFDHWVSVTNFFDLDPLMSDNGEFKQYHGDTSEIIVGEALKFIGGCARKDRPFFAVIWDGSPHKPWRAQDEDKKAFADLDQASREHYGELDAFDDAVGTLRKGLRDLKVADNTIVWFCSDNGGLPGVKPDTVGGLRGHKGSVWEGGVRVPGIVEWPARIKPRVTSYPASTMDIFPTIADLLSMPADVMLSPVDGASLTPLFEKEIPRRDKPIGFSYLGRGAWVDNEYKFVKPEPRKEEFFLYNLAADPAESNDLAQAQPQRFASMKADYDKWAASVAASLKGADYPGGKITDPAKSRTWAQDERYRKALGEATQAGGAEE